jgi:metallo-beta-lactamase class B
MASAHLPRRAFRGWSLLLGACALTACASTGGVPFEMQTWDRPFEPHRVAGNVYFVGRKNLGIFLVTTPAGHILIDSGFEPSVPALRASVEALGFRFSDIRYLLSTHAHVDHVQGHAAVRALTGARVVASSADARSISSGGKDDPYFGDHYRWTPCPVDRVIEDGDKVELGGTTLVARLTPGHTPGATTWTTTVEEGGARLSVVIFPSANILPRTKLVGNDRYPTIAADFERSFAIWRALPCDIFLGAHGVFYDLDHKYQRLKAGGPGNPFVDPAGFRAAIAEAEKSFRAQLADQTP